MSSRSATGRAGHVGLRLRRRVAVVALLAAFVAGCSGGAGPIFANPAAYRPSPPPEATASPRPPDPIAIQFPRDDGPHDRLTEWWYYTGHLRDRASGDRYGFEFVVFRAERGDFPVSWASHFAITDEAHGRFLYAQRSEIGPQGARTIDVGFSLVMTASATGPTMPDASAAWLMTGANGKDTLDVALSPEEAVAAGSAGGLGLQLSVNATKPSALHGGNGFVDFGPAGGSYYYSRTRMTAAGAISVDGRRLVVDGTAWFDHQWGDFIAVGGGGWDWFAVNLDDGTDLTISLIRDRQGGYPLAYGTLVDARGSTTHLSSGDFSVAVVDHWLSPRSGTSYPSGWNVVLPKYGFAIGLTPTVAGQELDTRATTGVVYWEGSQTVRGSHNGRSVGGQGYVELTGYGPPTATFGP